MIFIRNQADNLAAKFKETINQLRNNKVEIEVMANITSAINELIRNEFIILPQDKTSEYFNRNYITINPEEIVTNVLVGEEFRYTKIFANSFGPFNPQIFSTLDRKYRILWLLKEPYIKLESWRDGDKGGHDQASEYQTWEKAKQIPTYRKLIRYSRNLLNILGFDYGDNSEGMNQVLNHICVLQVNHFPGLFFNNNLNSNKNLIREWYEINQNLLKILIEFYDPQILIGGGTFNNFIDEDFKEVADNIKNEKLFIFGDLIENWSYVTKKDQKDQIDIEIPYVIGTIPDGAKDVLMNIKYKGNKRYYIQTNHPSSSRYARFKPDFAEKFDGPTILRWMNS